MHRRRVHHATPSPCTPALGLLLLAGACVPAPVTTPEENKEIVRRVIAEGVNRDDLEVFREMLAPDYVRHSQATTEMPEIRGVEEMLSFLRWNFTAFPDWHEEIDLMIAEGDRVAYITTGTGTHTGPMGDIPATGKKVEVVNFIVQRIEGGKIAETWVGWDNLAVLMQLGLYPPPDADGKRRSALPTPESFAREWLHAWERHRELSIRGVSIIELEADEIASVSDYHDAHLLLSQLGMVPALDAEQPRSSGDSATR